MNIFYLLFYCLLFLGFFEVQLNRQVVLLLGNEGNNVSDTKIRMYLKYILIFLVAVILFVISGFRAFSVGVDLKNYIPRYGWIGEKSWGNLKEIADAFSFEYGFTLFCKILYMINPKPEFFLIVTSLIVQIGFYNICKQSQFPVFSYFIIYGFGLWGSSFNVVRQFLAITILSFSIQFIIERKLWKFLAIVLLAASFHSGALIFIPLYFLYKVDFNSKLFAAFIIGCILMVFIGDKLLVLVISHTSFAWYLSRIGNGSGESMLMLQGAIFIAFYFFRNKISAYDKRIDLWLWILCMTITLNILALNLGVVERAMKFFFPYLAIIIPDIIVANKDKKIIYWISTLLVTLFISFYFIVIVMGNTAAAEGWLNFTFRQF